MIQMRNQGAMLSDPTVREGYIQGAMARGFEAAGSNANGSMAGFMGMGVGMQAQGAVMGNASSVNLAQMQMQQQNMQMQGNSAVNAENKSLRETGYAGAVQRIPENSAVNAAAPDHRAVQ